MHCHYLYGCRENIQEYIELYQLIISSTQYVTSTIK